MGSQLHKRFTDDQIKIIFELYDNRTITLQQALQQLGCSRGRFYQLLQEYRNYPEEFTIAYLRNYAQHRLPKEADKIILTELEIDKKLIENRNIPVWNYNYSAIRDEAVKQLGYNISSQTVRNRAKEWGYYIPKVRKEKSISREVLTEAPGILLQHDSSHHKWSPYVDARWTLITTIDDYSRYLLYAKFVEVETTWSHIQAVESVISSYGVGLSYYVDSHSIFRFVCHRDSFCHKQVKGTDDVLTQWKRVVEKCGMQVWYALSPAAKGKVERPYRWLQDRIVRKCARESVEYPSEAQEILEKELYRYNEEQVHSTTGEIPGIRLRKALKIGKSCFKPLILPSEYKSTKDIFCLHEFRKTDGYNRISWANNKIDVPISLPRGTRVELHVIPYKERTEVRLWHNRKVIKVVHFKN
jgi:hypothetical protein